MYIYSIYKFVREEFWNVSTQGFISRPTWHWWDAGPREPTSKAVSSRVCACSPVPWPLSTRRRVLWSLSWCWGLSSYSLLRAIGCVSCDSWLLSSKCSWARDKLTLDWRSNMTPYCVSLCKVVTWFPQSQNGSKTPHHQKAVTTWQCRGENCMCPWVSIWLVCEGIWALEGYKSY